MINSLNWKIKHKAITIFWMNGKIQAEEDMLKCRYQMMMPIYPSML